MGLIYHAWCGADFVLEGGVSGLAGGSCHIPVRYPVARASCHLLSSFRALVDARIHLDSLISHLCGEEVVVVVRVRWRRALGPSDNLENRNNQ
jgi:hypothetical protein